MNNIYYYTINGLNLGFTFDSLKDARAWYRDQIYNRGQHYHRLDGLLAMKRGYIERRWIDSNGKPRISPKRYDWC